MKLLRINTTMTQVPRSPRRQQRDVAIPEANQFIASAVRQPGQCSSVPRPTVRKGSHD